ncbi:MAG: hypothetical protein WAK55_24210 [Xanthobacteraceae bacterium]
MLATSALHASLAAAQTQQQIDWCDNSGNAFSVDQQLVGCTAIVPLATATAAGRIPTKAILIGPLPTATKRSGSIPN